MTNKNGVGLTSHAVFYAVVMPAELGECFIPAFAHAA